MGLPQLSNLLWRQREVLELLLFKLEEEHLLLAAGRSRWALRAGHEVELVREAVGQVELARAIEGETVAQGLGLPADSSLRELAGAAPSPWGDILGQHREQLLELSREVDDVGGLLGSRPVGGVETFHPAGSTFGAYESAAVQRAAVRTTARLVRPSLLEFLR